MTPWTQFVTKVYKDGKSKNTNYSLKDAMKRASKDYKKSKRLGGNKHVGGNSKNCGGKYGGGDIVDTPGDFKNNAQPAANTATPTGTPGDSKNNAQTATPIPISAATKNTDLPSPAATNNTGGRSKRQSAKSRTSTKRRLASKRSFGWM
jgi:hypothetical protein